MQVCWDLQMVQSLTCYLMLCAVCIAHFCTPQCEGLPASVLLGSQQPAAIGRRLPAAQSSRPALWPPAAQ